MTDAVIPVVEAAVVALPVGNTPPAAPSNEPPVIPAVTPVVPAVVEPVIEPPVSDLDAVALDTTVWGSTGTEVGDAVLSLLQNGGVTPTDAKALLFDAVQAGDITAVDRAALEAKVGKDKATLILAGAQTFIDTSLAKNALIIAEVHTAVGGEANWKALTAWANADGSVPDADMADYRDMINAGGAKARFAAQEIAAKYNADPANTTLNAADVVIRPGVVPATARRAITKAEYYKELDAAHRTGAPQAVKDEIQAARDRGRAGNI